MFVLSWDLKQLTVRVCVCMHVGVSVWETERESVCTWVYVCIHRRLHVCACVCVCDKENLLSLHISKDQAQDPRHSWIWYLFWGVLTYPMSLSTAGFTKAQQLVSDPLSGLSLASLWACCENHDRHTESWIPGADNITTVPPGCSGSF